MYAAMIKRQAADDVNRRKLLLISSLYANPNYDEREAKRPEVIQRIEEDFTSAVDALYGAAPLPEEEIKGIPFFDAMKVPELPPDAPPAAPDTVADFFRVVPDEE